MVSFLIYTGSVLRFLLGFLFIDKRIHLAKIKKRREQRNCLICVYVSFLFATTYTLTASLLIELLGFFFPDPGDMRPIALCVLFSAVPFIVFIVELAWHCNYIFYRSISKRCKKSEEYIASLAAKLTSADFIFEKDSGSGTVSFNVRPTTGNGKFKVYDDAVYKIMTREGNNGAARTTVHLPIATEETVNRWHHGENDIAAIIGCPREITIPDTEWQAFSGGMKKGDKTEAKRYVLTATLKKGPLEAALLSYFKSVEDIHDRLIYKLDSNPWGLEIDYRCKKIRFCTEVYSVKNIFEMPYRFTSMDENQLAANIKKLLTRKGKP